MKKVDVFCEKYGLIEFTEKECHKRFQNSMPLCHYRFIDTTKTIFEVSGRASLNVRSYQFKSGRWERVFGICFDSSRIRCGTVFGQEKLYIIGGRDKYGKYSKSVSTMRTISQSMDGENCLHNILYL